MYRSRASERRIAPESKLIRMALNCGLFIAIAMGLSFPSQVAAEDAPASGVQQMIDEQLAAIPTGEEGVAQIMGDLDTRLGLTPEQEADIRGLVEMTVAAMGKLRDRFKAGELKPMALAMQIQMEGRKTATLIEPLLDETQQSEYSAMRQEQRLQMMQAMKKQQLSRKK